MGLSFWSTPFFYILLHGNQILRDEMKKLLLSACVAIALCCSCSDTNSKISGKIDNATPDCKVYLDHIDITQITKVDSVEVNGKGEFTFKVKVENPEFYQLRYTGSNNNIYLLAEKDSTQYVTINSNASTDYTVNGSILSNELKKVVTQLYNSRNALNGIYNEMDNNPQAIDSLTRVASQVIISQMQFSRRYIIDNAGSPVTYFVLYQKLNNDYVLSLPTNLNYYRAVATNLNKSYPNAKYSKFVVNHTTKLLEQNTNAQINSLIANYSRDLPELRLVDSKGKEFDIEQLRGKTILLDFAMITAQETAAYQLELAEIHKKYASKGLVIVQVCFDKSKILWEASKRENNIKWICLLDEKGENSKILTDWNISTIPANYIIDKNFKIVGKNQFGANLSDYLKDILK